MKSTPTRGVKQFLKPDTYKQSEGVLQIAVASLKASLQAQTNVCRDGKFQVLPASVLVPGDLVILAAGSCVPADCRVNPSGKPGVALIDVDESYVHQLQHSI